MHGSDLAGVGLRHPSESYLLKILLCEEDNNRIIYRKDMCAMAVCLFPSSCGRSRRYVMHRSDPSSDAGLADLTRLVSCRSPHSRTGARLSSRSIPQLHLPLPPLLGSTCEALLLLNASIPRRHIPTSPPLARAVRPHQPAPPTSPIVSAATAREPAALNFSTARSCRVPSHFRSQIPIRNHRLSVYRPAQCLKQSVPPPHRPSSRGCPSGTGASRARVPTAGSAKCAAVQ